MISKDEAKKRMCVCFKDYCDMDQLLIALVRGDQTMLDKYKAMDDRINAYNLNMIAQIDAADERQLEQLVNSYQRPQEKPE